VRDPDIKGRVAEAWLIKLKSEDRGTLAGWVVRGPFHPFWQWWMVTVVHLRDIPGQSPAHKSYPEAEFEFIILSANPEHSPPDPDNPAGGYKFLVPPDVVEQFHGVSDHDAKRILESSVRAICDGIMSPDSDYRSIWKETLAGTVQHFREGGHRES
jgi:hypothetical protein